MATMLPSARQQVLSAGRRQPAQGASRTCAARKSHRPVCLQRGEGADHLEENDKQYETVFAAGAGPWFLRPHETRGLPARSTRGAQEALL